MIRVRDCQIATSVRGDIMPTVILCHSTGMGSMQWARIARGLAPRRCVMPDWLGYGKSDTVSDGAKDWTIDLDALLALIDAEESPVDLVGHSYGGFLALRAALRRPDRVRRLVVHEPVVWETLRTAGDRDHHEAFEALPPSRADVWRNNSAVISAEVHCLIDDETPYTAWAALNMPVLVTVGTATTPIEAHVCDVLQRAIPGAALTSVPGGHMAPVSKGRSWMDAALPFLA
jgi:pimeloyl-ACP methyl ester carboxylesterase